MSSREMGVVMGRRCYMNDRRQYLEEENKVWGLGLSCELFGDGH